MVEIDFHMLLAHRGGESLPPLEENGFLPLSRVPPVGWAETVVRRKHRAQFRIEPHGALRGEKDAPGSRGMEGAGYQEVAADVAPPQLQNYFARLLLRGSG